MARGHGYKLGTRGRSLKIVPGVGTSTLTARLQCSRCPTVGERNFVKLPPPDQIDQKFAQAGWALDPHLCVDCRAGAAKEKKMASAPSPAAIKAQARMFNLLGETFDAEKGAFTGGYDDQRIAKETGLAVDLVREFRREAFGEIKEAPEITALRADITALEALQREHAAAVSSEIASLRTRLTALAPAGA